MAAVERMSIGLRGAVTRVVVVSHESGSIADVDRALGAAGVSVLTHGSSTEAVCGSHLELDDDAVVVVAPAVDRKSCRAVRALQSFRPGTSVILVVGTAARGSLPAALRAGASAVVLRAAVAKALGPALEVAAAGQVSVPRELASAVARPVLTAREKQILAMLVLGFSNGEIARKLHVAESTVKSHLSAAFPKLGVRSRSEAAAAILDPETGLGTGILAISPQERQRVGTGRRGLAAATDGHGRDA